MKKRVWFLLLPLLLSACNLFAPPPCHPAGPPQLPPGSYADELEKVLALTNEARAHERLCGDVCFRATTPLTRNAKLDSAAGKHAEDMAATGVLSHETPVGAINYPAGSNPGQRIEREGYFWRRYAENIAEGQRDAQEVVADWLVSPGHCTNIMNPDLRDLGLGLKADSHGALYWVQDFASLR